MKKFVPRQRKHKVLARDKGHKSTLDDAADSNTATILPASKQELIDKKAALKSKLSIPTVSGKKAKRLDKYLETKLKKDENKALIEKLARSTTDTSLFASTRRLGQGKETKKQAGARALRERAIGIDIDGDHRRILFDDRPAKRKAVALLEEVGHEIEASGRVEVIAEDSASEAEENDSGAESAAIFVAPGEQALTIGGGLKRPLPLDDDGRPVLQKRQRRGGISSKVSLGAATQTIHDEPEWHGFSSASEMDTESEVDYEVDTSSSTGNSEESDANPARQTVGESESEEESEVESDSEAVKEAQKQRSSAFKEWANAQRNTVLGYDPASNVEMATLTANVEGFRPRAKEEDPLPAELQPSINLERKAHAITIARTAEIQATRLRLPVVAEEQKIMEAIYNNPTVVIYGATGSGKTTQVPQFLYEAGFGCPTSSTPGMIGVTQPRRVAAVSMAKRVADELGEHGKHVAYQIRFEGTVDTNTAIKFMTDGVLLREVAQDIALLKYSAIIIDEAHERSVNTDILIGMMSRSVRLREELANEDPTIKPLKLIIMSATLRITDFTENKSLFASPPPVLQAEGRQFTVTNHFARKTQHDYIEEAFRKISRGHRKLPPGGFLVFLTGQNEISQLGKKLKEEFKCGTTAVSSGVRISGREFTMEVEDHDFGNIDDTQAPIYNGESEDDDPGETEENEFDIEHEQEFQTGPARMHVLPLYSLLPIREQVRVFESPPDGSRMVVLATNVAETSLTIPGISFVFDCGRSKERKYDKRTGVQSFEVSWISKASASQRAGRAGRTGPGHCYKLYSSAVYEAEFPEFSEPEILRMPIERVVLDLKALNLQQVVIFPFPTPPDRQSLAKAERLLIYLMALSREGKITPAGTQMTMFPLSPRLARILLVGHQHNCLHYIIAIVAGLSVAEIFIPENQVISPTSTQHVDSIFPNPDRAEEEKKNALRRAYNQVNHAFCKLDDHSDAIKMLSAVAEYAFTPTEAWCNSHFVRSKPLKETLQLRQQLTSLLRTNIPDFAALEFREQLDLPTSTQVMYLKQMVAAGFIDNIAMREDKLPVPVEGRRKPKRAIDVPYVTLFPSNLTREDDDAVYIHPSSPLAHLSIREVPEFIVYAHLQKGQTNPDVPNKIPKTRLHALTNLSAAQVAAVTKGTPLLGYGKPIGKVMPRTWKENGKEMRECVVERFLRAEGSGGLGWSLGTKLVVQIREKGEWVVV